ncbi:ABC transporter permease subunit [Thermopolyspora sp. NPDC052614]|uniref:ABC transporter permease subunit n=1 Tax=Thermopolyspora sp. NPDC052614 TaxID=3155682 RepID=UPI00342A7119
MPPLMRKTLREQRRSVLSWGIGLFVFLLCYTAFYPAIRDDPVFYDQVATAKYPGLLRDLMGLHGSLAGPGYLQVMLYQLLGFLLFGMFAASLGAQAIAEPEHEGTLELTVTLPISRRRLLLERFGALAVSVLQVAVATLVLVLVLNTTLGIGADAGNVVAAHTGLFLVTLFFGTLTLAVGAATGSRPVALYVTTAFAIGGYAVETLGAGVASIAWLRWLSPFHYYLGPLPLFEGWPLGGYLVLLAATAAVLLAAVPAFDRRDVGV